MQKVEYRCHRCMIVESKWVLHNTRSPKVISCHKCGGESRRISSASLSSAERVALQEWAQEKDELSNR